MRFIALVTLLLAISGPAHAESLFPLYEGDSDIFDATRLRPYTTPFGTFSVLNPIRALHIKVGGENDTSNSFLGEDYVTHEQRISFGQQLLDGIAVGIEVPATSKVWAANGIGVYMTDRAPGGESGGTNAVGGFFAVRAVGDDANIFGINTLLSDSEGFVTPDGVHMQNEYDFNVANHGTTVSGSRLVLGGWKYPANAVGYIVDAASMTAVNGQCDDGTGVSTFQATQVTLANGSTEDVCPTATWGAAYYSGPGAAYVGLHLKEQGTVGNQSTWISENGPGKQSAPIWLTAKDDESVARTAEIYADENGALIMRSGVERNSTGGLIKSPTDPSVTVGGAGGYALTVNGAALVDGWLIVHGGVSAGKVLIDAVDGTGEYAITADGHARVTGWLNVDGGMNVGSTVHASEFITTSDVRAKKDISPLNDALTKVLALRGVSYNWSEDVKAGNDKRQVGLVAQNVEKVFPEVVSETQDGFKGVSYSRLVAPIIEAIREVDHENKNLKSANVVLRARLDRLEKTMRELSVSLAQRENRSNQVAIR